MTNQKNSQIAIFSTFAKDKLVKENGFVIRKQSGGPAHYLTKVFNKEKIAFITKYRVFAEVEILITKKGEFGKILKIPKIKKIPWRNIKTPYLVISTVLNEFDLRNLPSYEGKIFLDLQGYVRDGKNFGKKKMWNPSAKIFNQIFCLKGTKLELKNIPARFLKKQKQKILLITLSKKGCEAFIFGKRYLIRPQRIVNAENTIGAGDTFFAYFISKFINSDNILEALRYATKKTSRFLSVKQL